MERDYQTHPLKKSREQVSGDVVAGTLKTTAVVIEQPGDMQFREVSLTGPKTGDCIVDIDWSGISTGTERLLWQGRMPPFPGLSYPLVPGYESVGRIVDAPAETGLKTGQPVFIPGSRCFEDVSGLFGGACARLVADSQRVVPVPADLGEDATLLALSATALHAVRRTAEPPQLVVGHGVLGRLIARLAVAQGNSDLVVWETNPARREGAVGYQVLDPADDERRDYNRICDVSGDAGLLDTLIGRLAPGGGLTLAGFYDSDISFNFPQAFMREIELQIAAEWQAADLDDVLEIIARGELSLQGLVTHRAAPASAAAAYTTAFEDPHCLKMILDWRKH